MESSTKMSKVFKKRGRRVPFKRRAMRTFRGRRSLSQHRNFRGFNRSRKAFSPELKFSDVALNDVPIPAAWTIVNNSIVDQIVQDTGSSARVGDRIIVKKLLWRFSLVLPADVSPTLSEQIRLVVVVDGMSKGAATAVLDVFKSDVIDSFRNLRNTRRFKILFDKTFDLNPQGGPGATDTSFPTEQSGQWYWNGSLPIQYDATVGAITDLTENNIMVMWISKNGLGTIVSCMRLRYEDA